MGLREADYVLGGSGLLKDQKADFCDFGGEP